MIGEIINILPIKKSRNGNSYIRVEFKLDDGSFAKTDLCPDFRNWHRWKKYLRIGNQLGNLIFNDYQTIDADSRVIFLTGRKTEKSNLDDPKKFAEMCL